MDNQLEGRRVAILAADGYEESELLEPRKALDDAGATTEVISLEHGKIKGWAKGNWAGQVEVDTTADKARAEDYDALLIPGGVANPDKLRRSASAVEFVRNFFRAGKPVASICHGPWVLVEADVVRDRRMTSFSSIKTDLKNAGAMWQDAEVVTDGNLVTSRSPKDLPAFNEALCSISPRHRAMPKGTRECCAGVVHERHRERALGAKRSVIQCISCN